MIDLIPKELAANNIKLDKNGHCTCELSDSPISLREANKMYVERSRRNRKFILTLWDRLASVCSERSIVASETYPDLTRIFIESARAAFDMSQSFEYLRKNGTVEALQQVLDSDSANFPATAMNEFIDVRLAIEWVSHSIYKDIYIAKLIVAYLFMLKNGKNVVSYGADGFYSRLDLPMPERVYSFDEIEDEMRGRSRDIKNQRRYQAGLEGYNDPNVNEGFYWREIRNEPYSFDDEDNNPYPHRNMLWN